MGADLTKIEISTSPRTKVQRGKETLVNLCTLRDLDYWRRAFDAAPDTKLLIMDPVTSYMPKGASDQKNDDVRATFEPFIEELIRPRGIAFIAITHLNKSLEAKSVKHRINASIAFVNIPRNVHAILKDADDPLRRVFGQIKCNNAPASIQSLKFTIQGREVDSSHGPLETSIPIFDPELYSVDLDRTMSGEKGHKGPQPVESTKFATWLFEQLSDGSPAALRYLIGEARAAGLMLSPTASCPKPSISPIYNARDRLPKVHPGWYVEQLERDGSKHWQLVKTAAPVESSGAPPF
jgi:hypothetical protein